MSNRVLTLTGAVVLLVLSVTLMFFVYGQHTTLPDLAVSETDISFSPGDDVHVGTITTVDANIHNYGICWTNLSDNGDYMGYNVYLDSTKYYKFNASIRWSANHTVDGYIYIKLSFDDPGFTFQANFSWSLTADIEWRVDTIGEFPLLRMHPPLTRNYTLRVNFLELPGEGTLKVDWIKLHIHEYEDQLPGTEPTTTMKFFEAETYVTQGGLSLNPDKRGVNEIVPNNVIVQFYDNDPNNPAAQIGSNQTVGNTNTLQDGTTVKYMKNGDSKTASVHWTAYPPGYHNIYVVVDPDDNINEGNETNNQVFKTIGVYAILTITAEHPGGTTNPSPGNHNYYGGSATVTAIPDPGYDFNKWLLNGQNYGTINPTSVTMNEDHDLHADFKQAAGVGGIYIPIDKLALLAPYFALAVIVGVVAIGAGIARKHRLGKSFD